MFIYVEGFWLLCEGEVVEFFVELSDDGWIKVLVVMGFGGFFV